MLKIVSSNKTPIKFEEIGSRPAGGHGRPERPDLPYPAGKDPGIGLLPSDGGGSGKAVPGQLLAKLLVWGDVRRGAAPYAPI